MEAEVAVHNLDLGAAAGRKQLFGLAILEPVSRAEESEVGDGSSPFPTVHVLQHVPLSFNLDTAWTRLRN